tara:strand:+ start:11315 stop:12037 length:723 start_codon:yes stop_codon:yes gene_type:complete
MKNKIKKNKLSAHVLVIDDDRRLNKLLQKFLYDNDHSVDTALDSKSAKIKMSSVKYDIIILDIMMPGESGLELLPYIQKKYKTPVLMLSAMKETKHKIDGLEKGADDYLGKPFEPKELLLRIEAILKRVNSIELTREKKSKLIRLGKISYDSVSNIIWKNNKKIFLTYKEGLVLKELINSNGVTIDRYSLTNKLQLGERSIDITISRLRKKIEDNPKLPEYILTDRGKGYIINNEIRENL